MTLDIVASLESLAIDSSSYTPTPKDRPDDPTTAVDNNPNKTSTSTSDSPDPEPSEFLLSTIDDDIFSYTYIPSPSPSVDLPTSNLLTSTNRSQSPLLRLLPPELISTVLCFCLSPFSSYKSDDFDPFIPFRLSSVCSDIRHIALSTAELWARPTFLLQGQRHFTRAMYPLMECWLARSKAYPLSLRIIASSRSPDKYWDAPTRALITHALFSHQRRWKEMDIRLSLDVYRSFMLNIKHLPLLEHLFIKKTPGMQSDFLVDLTTSAPNLKSLCLIRFYLRSVEVGWDRLTHLELRQFFMDEVFVTLRRVPNLVYFKLRRVIEGGDGHPWPTTEPVVVPNLRVFDIGTDLRSDLSPIFVWTRMPALRLFRFLTAPYCPIPTPSVTSWLTVSEPTNLEAVITVLRNPDEDADMDEEPAVHTTLVDNIFDLWATTVQAAVIVLKSPFWRSDRAMDLTDEAVDRFKHGGDDADLVEYYLPPIASHHR